MRDLFTNAATEPRRALIRTSVTARRNSNLFAVGVRDEDRDKMAMTIQKSLE
jgi:hypothetical protein